MAAGIPQRHQAEVGGWWGWEWQGSKWVAGCCLKALEVTQMESGRASR